ncbi:DUF3987 domain-containing protein [Sabulicella glaciei]|uniref:YfjI family protein n=1 Tax=Sabulicella glaciei TaxID=2984948 RepID=A0ABT3NWR2_9PROT|nr:DUF3987 domain-containing protein [Roseococcus sp. MDT2-1-1]MCW8086612.1 YfjI family protein [Roseococcus sp. MDT2-1-1]
MADGYSTREAELPLPSLALLRDRQPPPALPLALFGSVWASRIAAAAEAKNCPPDYVAAGLLAASCALIGNSRWASPWEGWAEPPFLWCGAVGNPSSGKSPGLDAVLGDVLPDLETELAGDYPDKLREWEMLCAEAEVARGNWEGEVRKAVKDNTPPPARPDRAAAPPRPIRPRIVTSEPTVQKVAELLRDNPRGLLLHRDELAAFIGNFDAYSGGKGGERAAWLESYGARPKTIDRVKHPEPIFVRRFGAGIVGTIQPDRLEEITTGADDGFPSRFLWFFPEPRPFARPTRRTDPAAWAADLRRLLALPMVPDEDGEARPWFLPFTEPAQAIVEEAARDWAGREASAGGLVLGVLGKARGQMVRLALVLELVRWCAERPTEPAPEAVGEAAAEAAAGLLDGYFLPMAERAFGAGALREGDRHGRTLLRHIIAAGLEVVNERAIRETPGLPGLSCADAVKMAVAALRRDDVLLPVSHEAKPGRPRGDYRVNPKLAEVAPAWRSRREAP